MSWKHVGLFSRQDALTHKSDGRSLQKQQPELIAAKVASTLQSYNIASALQSCNTATPIESSNDGRSRQKRQPELIDAKVTTAFQNCNTATTTGGSGLWGERFDIDTIIAEGRYLGAEVEPLNYQDRIGRKVVRRNDLYKPFSGLFGYLGLKSWVVEERTARSGVSETTCESACPCHDTVPIFQHGFF